MSQVIQPKERPHLLQHFLALPPSALKLLSGAMGLALVGMAVYVFAAMNHPTTVGKKSAGSVAPSSGFVADGSTVGRAAPPDDAQTPSDTWTGWTGAKGMKLGFGFAGRFVIGFIFRAFLKLAALATVIIGGGLAALSYFHFLNIDFTRVHQAYADNSAWIHDQAWRLKEVLLAHLPSSTTGAAGAWFGTRRR